MNLLVLSINQGSSLSCALYRYVTSPHYLSFQVEEKFCSSQETEVSTDFCPGFTHREEFQKRQTNEAKKFYSGNMSSKKERDKKKTKK